MSTDRAGTGANGAHAHGASHPASPASPVGTPRKKQKRNKPTLSCEECVERKTKCDRGRPTCLACIKRQCPCRYSEIANLIASAGNGAARRSLSKKPKASLPEPNTDVAASPKLSTSRTDYRSTSACSSSSSGFLLSNIPYSKPTPSNIFGVSSEHPFANYWTIQGGVPEVVGVLPSKDQADILVAKFFESVDPVYPMIDRNQFYDEYQKFWSSSQEEKHNVDPTLIGLHFVVYAMGAQFIQMDSEQQKAQIAEFYLSAAHQSLRISSYLNRSSLRTIQAMILISYFLMNDNKAPDAWSFGGVLVRQAYAIGLNRDPDFIVPEASLAEKQQRRKVWQAVFFQDTFLTVLLKLPPTTTFSDVNHEALVDPPETSTASLPDRSASSKQLTTSAAANPMSISAIAPSSSPAPQSQPPPISDVTFIRCMWRMATLVQSRICTPRALHHSLATSPRARTALLNQFTSLYSSFPNSLTDTTRPHFASLVSAHPRVARQNLFLRSNYWHCVMILQNDEYEPGGVRPDVRGVLEAGGLALGAFFDFWEFLRSDASVWWVFLHRAFEEALTMAMLLSSLPIIPSIPPGQASRTPKQITETSSSTDTIAPLSTAGAAPETLFIKTKDDIKRMLEILEQVGSESAPELQKTRTEVLRGAWEGIGW